jgi:hypothetical protein
MLNIPIMETDIVRTINSMNNKNSLCFDEISSKLLKCCAQYLSKTLAYIYSTPISQGKFPDHLKYSAVVVVCKNGEKSLIANYRLISLLTGFSKIYEI